MSRSDANRGKGPGNPAPVDTDTRAAYRAMYGQPTRAKSFPVVPVPECPSDARAHLLLVAKADPYAHCASVDEVAKAAAADRVGVFRAVRDWTACRLCSREEMRSAWDVFARQRAFTAIEARLGKKPAELASAFLSAVEIAANQAATDMLRAPRTKQWLAAWNRDLDSAVDRLVGVLRRQPSADHLHYLPGAACEDPLATISEALRAFAAREVGLKDNVPKRERPNAERRAFAVTLTHWVRTFLDSEHRALVAAVIGVVFGCRYSTRQLRRDIGGQKRADDLGKVSA